MPAQPAFLREETSDDRRMSLFPTLRWIRTLGVKCIAGAAEGVLRVRQFQAWWFLGAEVADELRRVVRSARRQPKRSRNGEPRRFTRSPSGTFTRPGLAPGEERPLGEGPPGARQLRHEGGNSQAKRNTLEGRKGL